MSVTVLRYPCLTLPGHQYLILNESIANRGINPVQDATLADLHYARQRECPGLSLQELWALASVEPELEKESNCHLPTASPKRRVSILPDISLCAGTVVEFRLLPGIDSS